MRVQGRRSRRSSGQGASRFRRAGRWDEVTLVARRLPDLEATGDDLDASRESPCYTAATCAGIM